MQKARNRDNLRVSRDKVHLVLKELKKLEELKELKELEANTFSVCLH